MLKLTRQTTVTETGRAGEAFARPGMDTRSWVSFAIVNAVGMDPNGVIVDVQLMPSGELYSARLAAEYAGPGYGFYIPIGVNDEVLVTAPSGDPLHGLVVTKRFHSASDPLPAAAVANPLDLVLVVKPGVNLRLEVSGGGTVILGGDSGGAGVARLNDHASLLPSSLLPAIAQLETMLDARYTVGSPTSHLPLNVDVAMISSASKVVVST